MSLPMQSDADHDAARGPGRGGDSFSPVAYMVDCGETGDGWNVRIWTADRRAEAEGCALAFGVPVVPLYAASTTSTPSAAAVAREQDAYRKGYEAAKALYAAPAAPAPGAEAVAEYERLKDDLELAVSAWAHDQSGPDEKAELKRAGAALDFWMRGILALLARHGAAAGPHHQEKTDALLVGERLVSSSGDRHPLDDGVRSGDAGLADPIHERSAEVGGVGDIGGARHGDVAAVGVDLPRGLSAAAGPGLAGAVGAILDHAGKLRPGASTSVPDALLAKLRDAALIGGAGGGWRPIETAPKDTTDILVWRASANPGDSDLLEVAFWHLPSKRWCVTEPWCAIEPTHWQPLPAPPRALQDGGDDA